MLEISIKVNGCTTTHIYCHNKMKAQQDTTNKDSDAYIYEYQIYSIKNARVKKGIVLHKRSDSIEKLAAKIFSNSEKINRMH